MSDDDRVDIGQEPALENGQTRLAPDLRDAQQRVNDAVADRC